MLSLQEQVSLQLCIVCFPPRSELKCHRGHALETPSASVHTVCVHSITVLPCVAQDYTNVAYVYGPFLTGLKRGEFRENLCVSGIFGSYQKLPCPKSVEPQHPC